MADAFIPNDGPAHVTGSVQKGPFVLGSSVTLSPIDGTGTPTGQVFNTQTSNDLGAFSVLFSYRGNVDMQAQGYFYDEVTGALSTSQIVLRALCEVTNGGPQSAYINILTHLAHDRALALMGDGGVDLNVAEARAENELIAALGIGGSGFQPGGAGISSNELGGDTDPNAYLFAVSAVLVQAAREQAGDGGSVDATLQQLINTIASDLAGNGQLPSTVTAQIRTAEQDLDVDLVMDLFAQRLVAIGSSAPLPDLNRAIDSDGDGYRNSIDTCPLVANPNQAQIPTGVICKVTRHTTFLPPGSNAGCVLPGTFDDAGEPSVLGCGLNGSQSNAGLYRGDGMGRFSVPYAVQLPSGFSPSFSFDVNQDGNIDLASGSGWVPGDGAGGFGAVVGFPAPVYGIGGADAGTFATTDGGNDGGDGGDAGGLLPAICTYGDPVLGDFNGDAINDLVRVVYVGDSCSRYGLAVALGTARGVFGPAVVQPLPLPSSMYWQAILVGDVNGDRHLDLVVVGNSGGLGPMAVAACLGDGAGNFSAGSPVTLGNMFLFSGSALADFDGDGNIDLAAWGAFNVSSWGGLYEPRYYVAYGDGDAGFASVTGTATILPAFVAADVNADGKTDLLAMAVAPSDPSGSTAQLEVLLSQGRTFASPQGLRTGQVSAGSVYAVPTLDLASEDLNGDGVPDAVLVSQDLKGSWTLQAFVMNVLQ